MTNAVDGFFTRVRELAAPDGAGAASPAQRARWAQLWDQAAEVACSAFEERDPDALLAAHQALAWLYDQHFLTPDQGPVGGQFHPGAVGVQQILEDGWERAERARAPWDARDVPTEPTRFARWLEEVVAGHAVCGHPLFDFLAEQAGRRQVLHFLKLDGPLNVRFYEVLLMAMVGARGPMRQEMVRNLVDETGDGDEARGHANLCRAGLEAFRLSYDPLATTMVHGWQGLAGYNHVVGMALHRRHHFRMIGTLAVTEAMDPPNYTKLLAGCTRVGLAVPAAGPVGIAERQWDGPLAFYAVHIVQEADHAAGWTTNVVLPRLTDHPDAAHEIALGAIGRLNTAADYYDHLLTAFTAPIAAGTPR
ncbi:iron-containing redox enzyme family protein [Streptomyces sp. NPDC020800]|uniref:iron-containing redox enzyme family protein n=1 Tax=Streptomyces sp. NPDC020800 TaxID=3365092 RepID=UPI0037A65A9C